MGFMRMQRLTHDMENVLSEVRSGKMKVSSGLVDILFKGLDALEAYLANIQSTSSEGEEDNEDIINALNNILTSGQSAPDSGAANNTYSSEKQSNASQNDMADTGKMKFKAVKLEEHEKKAIVKAQTMDLNVIGLTVYLSETCVLKGARAFMINRAIEEHGEIIKLNPSAQDLEDEKYDYDYSVFIITKENPDVIVKAIMNVSEVKEVVADYITLSQDDLAKNAEELKKEEAGTTVNQQTAVASGNKPAQAAAQKNTGKQVTNRSVRVDIDKLDVLMNLVSELIIAKNGLVSSSAGIAQLQDSSFREHIEYLERITTNINEAVMKTRMVPIESVVNRFPRMIRDLSKQLNKEMNLIMTGEDTELDRTVIDEIGDPLMHLLRNAADHGLEPTNEERKKLGKDEVGTIQLNAYQDGNSVVIEVKDDGRGINVEKVKKVAVERGVITNEQAQRMEDKDAIDLLFRPSFSTSDKVTDVSGRGVGLDVVKTKIEALGGEIEARTKLGEGTSFIIRLPLTLAILQSLMVVIGDEKYALPLGNIQSIEEISKTEIKTIQDKEVINLRGSIIPIVRLGDILGCKSVESQTDDMLVIIVKKGSRLAGMVVDELIGQQEIVYKSVGKYIKGHKIVSGATILGNGEIVLILDVNSLV